MVLHRPSEAEAKFQRKYLADTEAMSEGPLEGWDQDPTLFSDEEEKRVIFAALDSFRSVFRI